MNRQFKHMKEIRFSRLTDAKSVTQSIRRKGEDCVVSRSGNQVAVFSDDNPDRHFQRAYLRLGRIPDGVSMN